MKKIQQYTQEQFDEKLQELHQELSRIKPAIDCLEKIASDSGSILQYQSNTAGQFESVANEFALAAKEIPVLAQTGLKKNLDKLGRNVGKQTEDISILLKQQSETLNDSFTQVSEVIDAINGISDGVLDFNLDAVAAKELNAFLEKLKTDFKKKTDQIAIEFDKKAQNIVDSNKSVNGEYKRIKTDIENLLKKLTVLHDYFKNLELKTELRELKYSAAREETLLKEISVDQKEQGNQFTTLFNQIELVKASANRTIIEIQKIATQIEEKDKINRKLLKGNRTIGILNLIVTSGVGLGLLILALKSFNII